MKEKICEEDIVGYLSIRKCIRKPKVEINGKYYCAIHCPEQKEKRAKIKNAKLEKEQNLKEYKILAYKYCKNKKFTLEQLRIKTNE